MNLTKILPRAKEEEGSLNWTYLGMSLQVVLMLGALTIALFWIVDYLVNDDSQREVYTNLVVDGERYSSLNRILFQTQDIREAQQNIEQLAWIKSARIRVIDKQWLIELVESLPIAQLEAENYMFADGSIIQGKGLSFGSLPQGLGRADSLAEIAPMLFEMINELGSRELRVRQFKLDPNGALLLALADNKIIRLGSRDHLERFNRLLAFVDAYDKELARVQSIDLRYDNALAIKWQEVQS